MGWGSLCPTPSGPMGVDLKASVSRPVYQSSSAGKFNGLCGFDGLVMCIDCPCIFHGNYECRLKQTHSIFLPSSATPAAPPISPALIPGYLSSRPSADT
ncbi:hypothetical protein CDAR_204451 [Caerostris darwini]|uniref:Uncharacterized protein n=1 Tax=Caerostris darwini TaxID=1538125 RepID=A0AAV4QX09_9ARAC|nr:hypothetical protein CDAR_204451 [Caerostris darwini]